MSKSEKSGSLLGAPAEPAFETMGRHLGHSGDVHPAEAAGCR